MRSAGTPMERGAPSRVWGSGLCREKFLEILLEKNENMYILVLFDVVYLILGVKRNFRSSIFIGSIAPSSVIDASDTWRSK